MKKQIINFDFVVAPEKEANMPVRGVAYKNGFVVGFMENEKGYVDLDKPLAGSNYDGEIYFGKTVYIALVNDKYDPDIISKMSSYSSTLSAKNAAENELNAAKTAAGSAVESTQLAFIEKTNPPPFFKKYCAFK